MTIALGSNDYPGVSHGFWLAPNGLCEVSLRLRNIKFMNHLQCMVLKERGVISPPVANGESLKTKRRRAYRLAVARRENARGFRNSMTRGEPSL